MSAPNPHRDRLIRFYQLYAPEKLDNVETALATFAGREDKMFATLVKKYGPEPPAPGAPVAAPAPAPTKDGNPHRERLIRFYTQYQPDKLDNVETALSTFAGREDKMFATLVKKYGPEPPGPNDAPAAKPAPAPVQAPASSGGAGDGNPYRERLIRFYQAYAPDKISNIDTALTTFAGREEKMFATLVKKYGPEPEGGAAVATSAPSGGATTQASASPKTNDSAPAASPRSLGENPHKGRLVRMLTQYAPDKLGQADAMLVKFAGKEEDMFASLVKRMGPEPPDPGAASPSPPPQSGYKGRLVRMLTQYAPDKLGQADAMLVKFKGKEEDMFASLVKRMGPEPPDPALSTPGGATQSSVGTAGTVSQPASPSAASQSTVDPTKARLIRMIQHYSPGKMNTVDAMLAKYSGKEDQMFSALVKKLGPEPPAPAEDQGMATTPASPAVTPGPGPQAPPGQQQQQQQQPSVAGGNMGYAGFSYTGFLHTKIGEAGVAKLNTFFKPYLDLCGEQNTSKASEFVIRVGVCAECCDPQLANPFQRYPNPPEQFDEDALNCYLALVDLMTAERTAHEDVELQEDRARGLLWTWAAEDKARIERLVVERVRHKARVATKAIEIIHALEEKLRREIEEAYRLEFLGRIKWFKDTRDKIMIYFPPAHMSQIEDRFTQWKDLMKASREEAEREVAAKKRRAAQAAAYDSQHQQNISGSSQSPRSTRRQILSPNNSSPQSGEDAQYMSRPSTGKYGGGLSVGRRKELEIELAGQGTPRKNLETVAARELSFRQSFAQVQQREQSRQANQHVESLKQEYQAEFGLSDEDAYAAAEQAYRQFYYSEVSPRRKLHLHDSKPRDQKAWNQFKTEGVNPSRVKVRNENVKLPAKYPLPQTVTQPFAAALPGGNNISNLSMINASGGSTPRQTRVRTPTSGTRRQVQYEAAPSPNHAQYGSQYFN